MRKLLFVGLASIALFGCGISNKQQPLFTSIPLSESGVDFSNTLTESADFNIIEYLYFYNGGGVAIGDVNNDRLPDLYFSSNQGSNKLYLNLGDFKFKDITMQAGVSGKGNWKTGVSFVDINADGLLDIFLCGVGGYKKFNGFNQVFINQGNLTFVESANEFGLGFQGFSTHAAFLDYDLDGDLDIYLLNHSVHSVRSFGNVSLRDEESDLAGDKLYENQLVPEGKTYFKEVTGKAGIYNSAIGYGLGVGISDVNDDGWPDIYVSNDFHENDYLYLNNKDKTFKQVAEKALGHTSRFSMGNDIADINNDGLADIMTLDMLPQNESVIKTSAGEDNYEIFKFKLSYNFNPQVSRNCLQLNRFVSDTSVTFSDIALLAGVGATDWSWAPLLADFNGDGLKDIFVTNGIMRRPNDMDYINFISDSALQSSQYSKALEMMPSGEVSNYFYRNNDGLTFNDESVSSGISIPSLSNGAAYGDLDNDGDLDLVINLLNSRAMIYKNNTVHDSSSYLKIELSGPETNKFGIGTKLIAFKNGKQTHHEAYFSRGFCSSVDPNIIMSSGSAGIDSLLVIWPGSKFEVIKKPKSNTNISLNYSNSALSFDYAFKNKKTLLVPVDKSSLPDYTHHEDNFNAFSAETLIPHALTNLGPPMALGDVNGDELDDLYIGGSKEKAGQVFIQTKVGGWTQSSPNAFNLLSEVTDAEFFDVDSDSDLDLVTVSGGQEEFSAQALMPKLYLNDGKGKFQFMGGAFGSTLLNASCVKVADYESDGDLDLFIGASVVPQLYGMTPVSYLLTNSGNGFFSENLNWLGDSKFDNIAFVRPGMVKDAVWTKVNNDDLIDLVLVGEWMPITILIQQSDHTFKNQTEKYGLTKTRGWWNKIATQDFDRDGDQDWVVGNLGLCSRLRASAERPVKMYLGDFDSNGGSDHILVYFNGDKSYPFTSRDQLVKQLPSLKKKFLKYKDYRDVKLEDLITPVQKGNSTEMQVEVLESVYLENTPTGITVTKLPVEVQMSPVLAILEDDVNGDGNKDIILGGNLSEVQPELGPYDSSCGLVILGDGKNNWRALSSMESGLVVKGEIRSIKKVVRSDGQPHYLFTINDDSIVGYKH